MIHCIHLQSPCRRSCEVLTGHACRTCWLCEEHLGSMPGLDRILAYPRFFWGDGSAEETRQMLSCSGGSGGGSRCTIIVVLQTIKRTQCVRERMLEVARRFERVDGKLKRNFECCMPSSVDEVWKDQPNECSYDRITFDGMG